MSYFSESSIFKEDDEPFDKIGHTSETDFENVPLSDAGFPIEEEFDNDKEEPLELFAAKPVESIDMNGIYVNLDDRALAIEGIMFVYNHNGKLRGAKSDMGFRNIVKRHGVEDANLIVKEMTYNDKLENKTLDRYFDVLVASRSMKEAGYSDEYIQQEKQLMRSNMQHKFGAEAAKSYNREQLIKKVQPPQDKHLTKKNVR